MAWQSGRVAAPPRGCYNGCPLNHLGTPVDPIAAAEAFIVEHPFATDADILRRLLAALQEESRFDLHGLYQLNLSNFDLAMEVLNAWRLQRYVRGGAVVAMARIEGH